MSLTAYDILRDKSTDNLKAQVTSAIANSWQPYGKPFVTEEHFVCKAMVQGSQVLVGATGATGATGAGGATGATGPTGAVSTFYGETTDAANTYTATIAGATLANGTIFAIKFDHAPTGAATLNVNGLGAHAIVLPNGNAIADTQGVDGQINWMVYDLANTRFVLSVTPNNA